MKLKDDFFWKQYIKFNDKAPDNFCQYFWNSVLGTFTSGVDYFVELLGRLSALVCFFLSFVCFFLIGLSFVVLPKPYSSIVVNIPGMLFFMFLLMGMCKLCTNINDCISLFLSEQKKKWLYYGLSAIGSYVILTLIFNSPKACEQIGKGLLLMPVVLLYFGIACGMVASVVYLVKNAAGLLFMSHCWTYIKSIKSGICYKVEPPDSFTKEKK